MQIVADGAPEPKFAISCSACVYLSKFGRCQRIKSRFYAQQIAFPEDFACARWERFGLKKEAK